MRLDATLRKTVLLCAFATAVASLVLRAQTGGLTTAPGKFLLNGQPIQIISGEMHYARVPREYWQDRFRKAKAMGLNTISTYVFWNLHESSPGKYDFSGQKDIAAYVRMAGDEGLHVILRPGPYVCAEWDLGGYPAWLFKTPGIVLRSTDQAFTQPAERWLDRLGRELAPLLASRGGPIVAVQVENEYGSFGNDQSYMTWQRVALDGAGFKDVLLYTADGDVQLRNGTLLDLPAVVNFGPGGAKNAFDRLKAFRPTGPLMTGEYWAGWFDQWGRPHAKTNAEQQTKELEWMLDQGFSVNLYMFHGGTTFGFMNGANMDRARYLPQTSSYDYDSALDESGRPTPKYFAFRDVIARHVATAPPAVPDWPTPIEVPEFTLAETASLWSTLGRPTRSETPLSMEAVDQSYGYILYRTQLTGPVQGDLIVKDVRDYAQVYINGSLVGRMDRRLGQDRVAIAVTAKTSTLDILVENSGRVNFALALRDERKGITKSVTLGDKELLDWQIFTLPLSSPPRGRYVKTSANGPAFYRGTFTIVTPGDTFLDMHNWGKGTVWVNGHQLGRFWYIGPQQTLFVPGAWLRKGDNEVIVFDLTEPAEAKIAGLAKPILDQVNPVK